MRLLACGVHLWYAVFKQCPEIAFFHYFRSRVTKAPHFSHFHDSVFAYCNAKAMTSQPFTLTMCAQHAFSRLDSKLWSPNHLTTYGQPRTLIRLPTRCTRTSRVTRPAEDSQLYTDLCSALRTALIATMTKSCAKSFRSETWSHHTIRPLPNIHVYTRHHNFVVLQF